jgi:exosortase H (IPTLxxWG-CTERM-specific)
MVALKLPKLKWGVFRDPWVRFSVLFAVLVLLSEVYYYGVLLDSEPMRVYLEWAARVAAWGLNLIGEEVTVKGNTITGPAFAVQISPECDAVQLCAVLLSAIVSFQANLTSKLVGMVLGLIWLQSVNFVRIISLFYVGSYHGDSFVITHETIWPTILIAITLMTWIFWARYTQREGPQTA